MTELEVGNKVRITDETKMDQTTSDIVPLDPSEEYFIVGRGGRYGVGVGKDIIMRELRPVFYSYIGVKEGLPIWSNPNIEVYEKEDDSWYIISSNSPGRAGHGNVYWIHKSGLEKVGDILDDFDDLNGGGIKKKRKSKRKKTKRKKSSRRRNYRRKSNRNRR